MTTSQLSSLLLLLLTFGVCADVMGQRNPFDIKRMRGSEDVMVGPFSGTYVIGAQNDPYGVEDAPRKEVTVKKFVIDETEVSNKEYRLFVKYVRDSIVRTKLARLAEDLGLNREDDGIGRFAYLPVDTTKVAERYYYENYMLFSDDMYAGRRLNWDIKLQWQPEGYPDIYYAEIMDSI